MYTCFFIGHRDAPSAIQEKLNLTVEYLWRKCGVTQFVVGHHGEFDRMAINAVNQAKLQNPELYAYLLLERYIPHQSTSVFLPSYFDDYYLPNRIEFEHPRCVIEKANRKMLQQCDYLVAYVVRSGGNAAKILRSAKRMEKDGLHVINLATDDFPPK